MRHRWIGLTVSLAVGAAMSACGSSTAPKPTATQLMAAQLDTQAITAASNQQFDRYRLLAYPIAAMSENLTPATVSLMVDGAAQQYQALALEVVGTTAGLPSEVAPSDSFIVVVAWTGGVSVTDLIYMQVVQPDTLVDFADLTGTVPNFDLDSIGSTPVFNASITSASGGCSQYSLPELNEAVLSLLQGSTCKSGTATVAFSLYFTPNPPSNPTSTYVLMSQTIPAIRVVLPASTGGQERMRQLRTRLSIRPPAP
jgi:hypothetical protein